ncbi:MAG: type I-C CRISPR-associated protein Cas7/Csd2 [Kiritimatiellae bacterium]|nr:type I-C CRISPR-associated protein Cas7/Csd2 [Kiritimatiellia bacterium]
MNNPIQNKVDFAVIIGVNHANPNGDPLNANRPRQTIDRLGEISDVCLKRKIRNRLLEMGEEIFVQSDDNRSDEYRSLKARFDASEVAASEDVRRAVNEKWLDVRAFGQVFAFGDTGSGAVSIGIRGPVTIQSAYSLEPIVPESIQITKSVNLETNEANPDKKDADTMGMKHRVSSAVYVAYGAITPQLAEKTGFSADDAEKIKNALRSLFEGDASSARPEGSMEILAVIWCEHNSPCGQYSSAHVHREIKDAIDKDGKIDEEKVRKSLSVLEPQFLPALEGDELAKLPHR